MKTILLAVLVALAPLASAQTWPSKPMRIVVPYPPGGANDIVARALQPALAASLGQPVVVENRGGGATQIGTEAVARSAPDGTTFLLTNIALGANPSLFARLPYDTAKDLVPIALISTVPLVLVVHPSVAAQSAADFVKLAKAKPGSVNYASAGNGSANHLSMEMFRAATGIDVVHVPYKGFGPAMTGLQSYSGAHQPISETLTKVTDQSARVGSPSQFGPGASIRPRWIGAQLMTE